MKVIYEKLFTIDILKFTLFILFIFSPIFSTSLYAQIHQLASKDASCVATISNIHIAQGSNRPSQIANQNHWEKIKELPFYWNNHWPEFIDNAWYKIEWDYQCRNDQLKPATLVIENINMAGQLYINNEFLWESLSLNPPLSRQLRKPSQWIIPVSNLKNGTNTLLIHIIATPTQKAGLGKIHIGDYVPMKKIFSDLTLQNLTLNVFNLAINLIIALFCFMVWILYRKESAFLWFSLVSAAWSAYLFMAITSEPWSIFSNLFYDKLQTFIFCAYVPLGCLAIWRFAGKTYPKIEKTLLVFCVLAALSIFLAPNQFQPQVQKYFFICAVIIFLLKATTYPFVAYKTKFKEAYFLVFLQLVFIPIAINDSIYMLTNQGHILSPYTAPLSSLFVGFVLALRLARNTKQVAYFNKTLEETVSQTKQELTLSLSAQHKLELDNIKLQERINLSHDLHDSLGGSIVRSITLLDHHELSQQHMLSILKLLRSDLRQVIDTGSSAEAKSPETPPLWVASIRRRFIQLFEDLDIQSNWNIPPQWLVIPPPLYCLTLLRVAEEALTNIIKHSQAKVISVNLIQDWEHNLILEIIDNGVGFEMEQNTAANISIGLISMRVRVQRLGGILDIQSQPGHTVIRAILNLQRILDPNAAPTVDNLVVDKHEYTS